MGSSDVPVFVYWVNTGTACTFTHLPWKLFSEPTKQQFAFTFSNIFPVGGRGNPRHLLRLATPLLICEISSRLYMKVIGSKSRSLEQKKSRNSLFLQC